MINARRSYKFYIFYLLGFILFCLVDSIVIINGLLDKANMESFGYYSVIYGVVFMYILFGVFISLDHLYKEKRHDGVWMVDMPKVLSLGTPLGFAFLYYVLYHAGVSILPGTVEAVIFSTKYLIIWKFIFVLLGYVIGSSFYKNAKETD